MRRSQYEIGSLVVRIGKGKRIFEEEEDNTKKERGLMMSCHCILYAKG